MYQKKACPYLWYHVYLQYVSVYIRIFLFVSVVEDSPGLKTLQPVCRLPDLDPVTYHWRPFLGVFSQILKRQTKIEEVSKWVGFGVSCFSKIDSRSNESINWSLTLNSQDEIDEETFTPLRKQHTQGGLMQGGLMTVWKLSMLPSNKAFN